MRRLVAIAAVLVLAGFAGSPASARVDCHPYCDFIHDYGPYDLSWQRPGLTCHPRCDTRGRCAPNPACFVQAPPAGRSAFATSGPDRRSGGRIIVRSRTAPR